MANVNKKVIAEKLADKFNMSKKEATEVVESVFDIIANELVEGNKVDITGFGKFEVKTRAARSGINPQTKEAIEIPATNVPGFKASKNLKESVR